jgi:hypothetical protein
MPADAISSLTTRTFEDADETAILDLFARSFHVARTPQHFAWKYLHNPFGQRRISLTFDETGRLAGHYAGYPVPFWRRGENLLAHQIGDTMTDVAVRHIGRGPSSVLGRTAVHFYQTFCEGKIAFNYGFNVSNIQRFSLRFLRSDRVEPVSYRYRDLTMSPLAPIGRLDRWPRGYQLELVERAGEELTEFFARVAPAYQFLVRRDAAYLTWRYLESPDTKYNIVAIRKWRRLVGWIVFRIRERTFVVGDALFDSRFQDALDVVLRHVVPSHPVDAIEGWFPRRPRWFDQWLSRARMEEKPEPQDLSLMCVPFADTNATSEMREGLYYTMGDGDLF